MTARERNAEKLHKKYNEEMARITAMPAEQAKAEYMEKHKAGYEAALEQPNEMFDILEHSEICAIKGKSFDIPEWAIPAGCGLLFGLGVVFGLTL